MNFPDPLVRGTLVRRYKRFLADVTLETTGEQVVAHCPNPGAMTTCQSPGWSVWLSPARGRGRKLKWSWEIAVNDAGAQILVHTGRANTIVGEALRAGHPAALAGYETVRTEVRYGDSRFDFCLQSPGQPDCYVEVKNVSLLHAPGRAAFPDSRTKRGEKHLRELIAARQAGHRAAMVFLLARDDAASVEPADHIDPAYGKALRDAADAGVELFALAADFGGDPVSAVTASREVPVVLPVLSGG